MAFNYVGENSLATLVGDIKTKFDSKADITNVSNPNLLINPDFKINQRGKITYSIIGRVYTCDRWMIENGAVEIQNNGVKINLVGSYIPNFMQLIENANEIIGGKTVTLSANIDGEIKSVTYTLPSDVTSIDMPAIHFDNGAYMNFYCGGVRIFFFNDKSHIVYWVKLEVGSVATPFVPPNPTTELIKCKRYFEALNTYQDLLYGYAYNGGFICTHQMTPKRTMPTITSDNFSGIEVKGLGTNYTATISSYIVGRSYGVKGEVSLQVTLSTTLNTNVMYFSDLSNTQNIYIDAEM